MKPRGWIVCPAYDEVDSIEPFVLSLQRCVVESRLSERFDLTLLVIDDGSQDHTCKAVAELNARELSFEPTCIRLTRNFGQQAALIAGLDCAARAGADWVCTLDIDGEHPVSVIPQLVEHWANGAPIVHTVRETNDALPVWKRWSSRTFYWLLRRVSDVRIQPGMADFKLWDGDVLRQLQPFLNQAGLLRLFASWVCPDGPVVHFRQTIIAKRLSRYSLARMFSIAFAGLVRYSELPLRFFFVMGLLCFTCGVGVAIFAIVAVSLGLTVPGWASILVLMSLFGAVQTLSLGVLSEYFVRLLFRRSLPPYVTHRGQYGRSKGSG